jgi:ATP-binding cassette subfamily C protein
MMLGGGFLVAVLSMLFPLLTGYLIGRAIIQSQVSIIWNFAGLFLSASVLLSLFTFIKSILFSQFQINLMYYIQSLIMRQVLRLPLQFFEQYPTGELNQRIFIMESLSMILNENQFGAFITLICSFSTFGLMILYAWKLTLFLLLIVCAVFIISVWSTYRILPYLEAYTDSLSRTHGIMFQVIGGISRIKAFHKTEEASNYITSKYKGNRSAWLSVFKRSVLRFTCFKNFQLMMMLLLYMLTAFISQPTMPLNQFIIFFSAFMQFIVSFTAFNLNMTSWAHATITYRRLRPILQTETECTFPNNTLDLSIWSSDIIIKNIDFHYPSQVLPVIRNLSCTIPVGQHLAIVGFSGSGKTTLMKLLLGLYAPQKGDILFGNRSIKQINLSQLRQEIGVVLQDSKLFPGTILENILSHGDGSESEAWNVAHLVGLDKVIKSLPMGMHTLVSQHINLLSGGQKQLILIAKALAQQPKLLIFDEATNSLDNIAQQAVLNCINSLQITRISIAHRLSSIKEADKIIVLHQGTIVETGHYEQLIQNKNGFFYQLVKNQLSMVC